ncbi:MAG: type II toxin-antitoxin system HicB family antitoxin [Acinetobacter sp.]
MQYAVSLTRDTDHSYLVRCRDIPEALAVGYSVDEALDEAINGIETAFMIYMDERRLIPMPSEAQEGEYLVRLPARTATKLQLYNEMVKQKITKAELARRLNWKQTQVDRLWSLNHSTKLESIEAAFHAIGRQLNIAIA